MAFFSKEKTLYDINNTMYVKTTVVALETGPGLDMRHLRAFNEAGKSVYRQN